MQQERNTSGDYCTESHFHGDTKVKISLSVLIGGYMCFNNHMNQFDWFLLLHLPALCEVSFAPHYQPEELLAR